VKETNTKYIHNKIQKQIKTEWFHKKIEQMTTKNENILPKQLDKCNCDFDVNNIIEIDTIPISGCAHTVLRLKY